MAVTSAPDLLTLAKLAEAWGVPKARLAKLLKEQEIKPDQVKAGCSYYSATRLAPFRVALTG